LPESFPGVTFDAAGECSLCQAAPSLADVEEACERSHRAMEAAIEELRGGGRYECVVAYSGGKDSSYALKLLIERYHLRCLAVTVDNGFVSERARVNAAAVTGALGVDLLTFRPAPALMRSLYRESALRPELHPPAVARRGSHICASCIGVINREVMNVAIQNGTRLVAGGYVGGQVPPGSAVLRVDPAMLAIGGEVFRERALAVLGPEAARLFSVLPASEKVALVNPLLGVRVPEEELIAALRPLGWVPTLDTGPSSTNCRLNELGILVHYRRYGFNPYVYEIAEQVRVGLLDRVTALARVRAIPEVVQVAEQAHEIGLDVGALA
jgi:tRNA(Ile)-lysidine synthase TilS/MesJ